MSWGTCLASGLTSTLKFGVTTSAVVGGIGYSLYKRKPYTQELTTEQHAALFSQLPHLKDLQKPFNNNLLIGGSYALQLYTGRDFQVNDVDVFVSSKEGRGTNIMYERGDPCARTFWKREDGSEAENPYPMLDHDQKVIKEVYPDQEVEVRLVDDHPNRGTSMLNNDQGVEFFDNYIFGTINVPLIPLKHQFVMVDRYINLFRWYQDATDLPVFIFFDKNDEKFKWMVHRPFWARAAKWGYLDGRVMRHKERREKYGEKGFKVIGYPS